MFANRFDTLMNIAKISNSQLGQAVNMNGSYIGRLRSGARPLPKKHPYLPLMCRYLAEHITQDIQFETLYKLTGIQAKRLGSAENTASVLEHWLISGDDDSGAAAGRFISGFTRIASAPLHFPPQPDEEPGMTAYASYLFGNEGKRRAVEQFFQLILQEKEPQTLLLFSEEHMAWMYEDPVFAKRWAELFTKVLLKGNKVKIIHTVSRTMNEILEAVMKWVPIYMTGAIQPYYFPRLRDDLFQHTLFIAPKTAAIVSRSVQQNTDGMLNEFITDKEALGALVTEYERYFALCSPLMEIFTQKDFPGLYPVMNKIDSIQGTTYIRTAMPPLFAVPEIVIRETGSDSVREKWRICRELFFSRIETQKLKLTILSPEEAIKCCGAGLTESELLGMEPVSLTEEQYIKCISSLEKLEERCPNLEVRKQNGLPLNNFLYVKENGGVMMAKTNNPVAAFAIHEQNMLYAFCGYIRRDFEDSAPLCI